MFIGISLTQAVSDNIDIGLTPQEKAFLNGKTIRIGVDSARPPFEYIDEKGVYSGISAEIIQTCAKRLGVTIVPTSGLTIKEAIDKVKTGEIDVIPKITPTPEREKYLLFTNVYATFPSVIVARKDMRFIGGLDDLYGLKVGVLKGLIVADLLKRDYPKMQLISLPDIRSALLDLSVEKIDVFVDNLGTVSYNIDKLGLTNLKIAAPTPYNHDLAIGVKKDLPLLVSAMNKVLLGMSSQEKTMIKNHWLSIEYKQGTNWKIIAPIALSFFVIIVFILIWNRRLSLVVSQREKVQQELKNYALELQSNSAIKLQVSQIASELQKTMTFSEISLKFLSMTVPLLNASYGMLYIFMIKAINY
jgi:ABC-type amino acid transport substrate-binding protein